MLYNLLYALRKFEDRRANTVSEITSLLTPQIIDLGKHAIVKPSTHAPHAQVIHIKQLTLEALCHQAFITGFRPIPSLCCVQPPFWLAPGARAFNNDEPVCQVVMVFACFDDYQNIFQPGMQDVAEHAVEIYKACVQQAISFCSGYECQEVNAVFMLTFPDCHSALQFHLVLQQLLLIADWTPDMLQLPPMKTVLDSKGNLLHRGPRVKTGIYQGRARTVSPHSTTGRADYWGELVNRAARMMSAAKGGQVLCTKEIVDAVRPYASLQALCLCVTTETRPLDRLGQLGEFEQDSNTDSDLESNTDSHTALCLCVGRAAWPPGAGRCPAPRRSPTRCAPHAPTRPMHRRPWGVGPSPWWSAPWRAPTRSDPQLPTPMTTLRKPCRHSDRARRRRRPRPRGGCSTTGRTTTWFWAI